MAKKRAGSEIVNLTPNHKKSEIDPIYLVARGMWHTIRKFSMRATTLLETTLRFEVCLQSYGPPKSWESHLARFQDSHSGVPGGKIHLDVGSVASHKVYYKGEGNGFPQVRVVVNLMCPCCSWLVLTPKVLQLWINHFVWVVCRPMWMSEDC